MVAPRVPTGGLVGHAVLGHEADGHPLDAERVVAVGQGQVGEVGGEAPAAAEAAVAGELDGQIHGPAGACVAEVMERPGADGVASGAAAASRARAGRPVPAAKFDARLGQVLDAGDALGGIRDILPRAWHGPSS